MERLELSSRHRPKMLQEVFLALMALPRVELARARMGPVDAVRVARRLGTTRCSRPGNDRTRLQRAIRFVDYFTPSGPNCYRRALLEMALDAGAAAEPLMMGLRADGGPKSGHAWIGVGSMVGRYDAVISL